MMKYGIILVLLAMSIGCVQKNDLVEIEPVSKEFILREVLAETDEEKNIVFFINGKSCLPCNEDILAFVSDFDPLSYQMHIVSNDPKLEEALDMDVSQVHYANYNQTDLEKHGFLMANSEVYLLKSGQVLYKNIVASSSFEAINNEIHILND